MDKNKWALTPPMGWNSWDCYGASVTEEELLRNADYMAEHLKKYGWEYIVCDIQWYEPLANSSRYRDFADLCIDEYGRCIPAPNRFPSSANGKGFKPIADYIHAKGLKFGIHIMRGIPRQAVSANLPVKGCEYRAREIAHPYSRCCWNTDMYGVDAGKAGAQEYYDSLLELYAAWEVDFIKVDDICVKYTYPGDESILEYGGDEIELLRHAIDKCGREIVLSLSPGPAMVSEAEHLCKNANMWRITNDFWDEWSGIMEMFGRCDDWSSYVAPGCYPDCDMLPLGHISIRGCEHGCSERWTRFTKAEQRTMITLWSIFGSPLMLGCEMTDMDEWTLSLLTNEAVLQMLKNRRNSYQVMRSDELIVWTAEDDEYRYVAFFNIGTKEKEFVLPFEQIGLSETCNMQDMWSGEKLEGVTEKILAEVAVHDAKLYSIKKYSNE